MHGRGAWRRRGFAVAALVLTFAVVAPELATPVGAAEARVELMAKTRRRPVSRAVRRARILAAMKARGYTKGAAAAKLRAARAKSRTAAPKPRAKAKPAPAAVKRQRALAARRLATRRAAARRLAAQRAAKKKSSSLSLPLLVFLALAPFVLMGLYLLGSDYLRRRGERPPRKRRGNSLVITRVGDR